MKSSEVSKVSGSILAVYLPMSALLAFVVTAAGLIRLPFPALSLSIPFAVLMIPAALCGVAASFYHSLMRNVKADHTPATLRGAIIIMAAVYLPASLLRSGPFPLRFSPGLANIAAPLCACYIWFMTLFLKKLFDARELLEAYTKEHQGEKLRQQVLEDAVLLSSLDQQIGKTRRIFLIQVIIIFVLALIRAAVKPPLPVPEFLLLLLMFVNESCFFGLLEIFTEEHSLAGEGLAASRSDRSLRVWAAALFCLAALFGAVMLSPGKSILPLSLITGLFAFLAALISGLFHPIEAGELPPLEAPEMTAVPERMAFPFADAVDAEPWPVWEWLKYGVIVVAVLLFIGFMVKPLFERGRRGRALAENLRRIIAEWLKNLRAAAFGFFAFFRGREARVPLKRDNDAVGSLSEDLLALYSRQKRRGIRGGATLFARLIIWGDACGVSWKSAYGPGEYCRLLEAAVLKKAGLENTDTCPQAIIRCGELFEQLLYGPAGISAGEEREFKRLVEAITGLRFS
ncbi:MAG: hypothetical protein LBG76_07065 [Treponema sp.]|jgi:hypothetical protein|nr:hypothetical protein [Treponema sp.]